MNLFIDVGEYVVFFYVMICDDKYWLEEYWRELIGLLVVLGIWIKFLWGVSYEEEWVK